MIGRFEVFTFAISEISSCWNRIAAEELKPYGLKGAYIVYLIELFKNPDGLTSANLCEMCYKDKAEVSRAVSVMEKKGLIARENTGVNGYRAHIRLTEEGERLTKLLRERVKVAVEAVERGLPDEYREIFYNALEIISANLKKISKEGLPK